MKKKIYTISSAHLDTSWLWTQKETVRDYLPRTLKENFEYFNKYPEYRFNFEGSYRYGLIEETIPSRLCPCKSDMTLSQYSLSLISKKFPIELDMLFALNTFSVSA